MDFKGEHIWVIGASSGIGRAVAVELANQGATLLLSARRKDKLDALNKELDGQHLVVPVDVADSKSVVGACTEIQKQEITLNRVIFLPALYDPSAVSAIDLEAAFKAVNVNFNGALRVVHGVLLIFEKQQSGQLALCASVAGYIGLPNGQPYSATKAALINFAESLYAEKPNYLDVKVINPGFVKTPLTDKNTFDMPFIQTPQQAAQAIVKGLNKKAFDIHFPKKLSYILKSLAALPYWLLLKLTPRFK